MITTLYLYSPLGHFITSLEVELEKVRTKDQATRAPRLIVWKGRHFCLTEPMSVTYIEATPVVVA